MGREREKFVRHLETVQVTAAAAAAAAERILGCSIKCTTSNAERS